MNPFVVGTYISKEYFCDRRVETESLEEHVRNGRNVVLFSERRMGKTGLIQHVFHDLRIKKDFHCLYFDALACGTLQEFTFALSNSIFRSLKKESGFLEKISSFFRTLKLTMSVDPNNESPEVSLSLGDIKQPEKTIEEAFSFLDSLDKPVILAIDEFQKIASFKEADATALLRGIIQTKKNIRMIYAGSEFHLLSELFVQGRSPFYQSASMMHLNPIDKKEYFLFAEEKFRDSGKTIPEEIFYRIYTRFFGCTWFIQSILNRLYSVTQEGNVVSEEMLGKVLSTIVQEQGVFYRALLSDLSLNQKSLLLAIAKEGTVENPTSTAFVKDHSLSSVSSAQSSARTLLERGILQKNDRGLRIYDYFFLEWLKKEYF